MSAQAAQLSTCWDCGSRTGPGPLFSVCRHPCVTVCEYADSHCCCCSLRHLSVSHSQFICHAALLVSCCERRRCGMAATVSALSLPSSPPAAIQSLTAACDAYEATGAREAEAALQEFQALSHPFELTRYALQHSSSARLLHLCLSCHCTALIRQWPQLTSADRLREAEALLWFVSERATDQPPFVMSQSVHAAATLLKRCWLDGDDGAAWANQRSLQLTDRLLSAAQPRHARVGLQVVRSLVSEMFLSSRSHLSLGVSAISVVSAHSSFERVTLLPLFCRLLQLMRALLSSAQPSSDTADVLLHCVRALECCLSWQFRVDHDTALRYLSSANTDSDLHIVLPTRLQPSIEWRSVLLESDVRDVLVQCDRQLLSAHRSAVDVLLCVAPLVSLSGPVFHQPSEQRIFVDELTALTCHMLNTHQQQQQQCGQPLDGQLLSVVHSVLSGAMDNLSPAHLLAQPSFSLWLSCLSHITQCVLLDHSFTQATFTSGTDTTLAEALHAMLATWSELSVAAYHQRAADREECGRTKHHLHTGHSGNAALDLIQQHATHIFSLYIARRLKRHVGGSGLPDSEEGDSEAEEQFAGVDNEHEHLVSIAFLARLHPVSSLSQYQPLLAQSIQAYSALLSTVAPSASMTTTSASVEVVSSCERLLLLVDLLSCILADSAEGELTSIPSMLLSSLRDSSPIDSLVLSVASLLSLMVDVVRAGHSSRLSPTLAVSVLSLLHRTNGVYVDVDVAQSLYSNPSSARALLLSSFCLSTVLAVQFDAAYSFLSLWPGEQDVHDSVLRCLAPLIAQHRSRPVATSTAGYCGLWQLVQSAASLPSSSADSVPLTVVDRLSGATQSLLVSVLSQSCDDLRKLESLWSPLHCRLSYVMQRVSASATSWLSDACNVVYSASSVSLLCGVSDSTSAAWFDASFALLSGHWSDLTRLLRSAVTVPSAAPVVSAILSLLVSSAEHQLSYMDSNQSTRFMALCADVVAGFLVAMQQRAAALHSRVARAEVELLADSYEEDMTLLLRLLDELIRDDTWSAGVDSVERAGELCVMAVSTLASDGLFMQLLSASAASSSSSPSAVMSLFFSLLHDAFTTHTERVANLPPTQRTRLFSLLSHAPPQVGRQCLQCVAAMAAYHAKQRTARQSQLEDDVARMLHWLLTRVIREPVPSALMDSTSDALLACCVAVPQLIGQSAAAAINEWQQHSARSNERVAALQCSLERLVTGNNVRADLSMDNKRQMRANVRQFVSSVNWSSATV